MTIEAEVLDRFAPGGAAKQHGPYEVKVIELSFEDSQRVEQELDLDVTVGGEGISPAADHLHDITFGCIEGVATVTFERPGRVSLCFLIVSGEPTLPTWLAN
jgi:hypothetical protein